MRTTALVLASMAAALALITLGPHPQKSVAHTGKHPANSGFWMTCLPVDNGSYDPIVYPGQENVGHAHTFCGSEAVGPTVTREEQMAAPSSIEFSDGLAHGNHSIYWAPQLMTRDGEMVGMVKTNVYYRSRGIADAHEIKPFPEGLKLITRLQDGMTWSCTSLHSGSNGDERAKPYDCGGKYRYVTAEIRFPQCGDGRLDSADHTSHFAEPVAGECPTTHPFAFPSVKFKVKYDTSLGTDALLADGSDPDTGFHADLMEGWEPESIDHLLQESIYKGIFIENHYPESTVPEPPADEPGVEAPTTPALTTEATDTATLPDGTISDVATLDVPEGTTGTIEFKLYGPFTTAPGSDECTTPIEGAGSIKTVSAFDPANPSYTSDPYTPTEAGIYNWTASFTPDAGQDLDPSGEIGCGVAAEQSVVNDDGGDGNGGGRGNGGGGGNNRNNNDHNRRHHHNRYHPNRHHHHNRHHHNRFHHNNAAHRQYTSERIVEERVIKETIPNKGTLAATGGMPLTGAAFLGLASVGLGVSILRSAIRDPER